MTPEAAVSERFIFDTTERLERLTAPLRHALPPPPEMERLWAILPRLWLHGVLAIERLETARLMWFSARYAGIFDGTDAALGADLIRASALDSALMALCRLLDRSGTHALDVREISILLDRPPVLTYRKDVAVLLGVAVQQTAADSNRRMFSKRLGREKALGSSLSSIEKKTSRIRNNLIAHGLSTEASIQALRLGEIRPLAIRTVALTQAIVSSATLTWDGPLRQRPAIRRRLHAFMLRVAAASPKV